MAAFTEISSAVRLSVRANGPKRSSPVHLQVPPGPDHQRIVVTRWRAVAIAGWTPCVVNRHRGCSVVGSVAKLTAARTVAPRDVYVRTTTGREPEVPVCEVHMLGAPSRC